MSETLRWSSAIWCENSPHLSCRGFSDDSVRRDHDVRVPMTAFSCRKRRVIVGKRLVRISCPASALTKHRRGNMVPDPTNLYVVRFGLVLLAGASWYLRRRK